MTRDNASRPRSSVPSQWPGSAPACQKGGVAPRRISCSSGSFAEIHGAPSARISRNKMKPPPTTTLGSRKQARNVSKPWRESVSGAASAAASTMAQSWIGRDDKQIDEHIDEDEQGAKNKG